MENVMNVWNWIMANKGDLINVWGQVVLLVSLIIKFFPTLPADHWALGFIKFSARYLALNKNVTDADRPK